MGIQVVSLQSRGLSTRKLESGRMRFEASTRNAHLRKRILMRITQSTSVGGLNLHWFIDCEAREMVGSAWSVEETRALLNLWGDDRVQRQLEGSWKLFLTVGLCVHTLRISYDGRVVDRDDVISSHQRSAYAFMHVIMRLFIGDSASSVQKLYTNVIPDPFRLARYKMADGSGYETTFPARARRPF